MSAASTPFIQTLQRAMRRDRPSLISIGDHGSISIYPGEGTYTTDIRDWDSVPWGGNEIRVSSGVWATAPEGSMPVQELHWLAAYHSACGAADARLHGLAKLVSWPDLSEVPDEIAAPVARLCALLWRKPTASALIARLLGSEPAQTEALLRVLQLFGHVVVVATGIAGHAEDEAAMALEPVVAGTSTVSARASVISKLWQRLVGG
jgi:hypothetical protein